MKGLEEYCTMNINEESTRPAKTAIIKPQYNEANPMIQTTA